MIKPHRMKLKIVDAFETDVAEVAQINDALSPQSPASDLDAVLSGFSALVIKTDDAAVEEEICECGRHFRGKVCFVRFVLVVFSVVLEVLFSLLFSFVGVRSLFANPLPKHHRMLCQ